MLRWTLFTLVLTRCVDSMRPNYYEPGGWGAFPTVAIDPTDRHRMVAGADVGGLYVSTDAGTSWDACGDSALSTAYILDARFIQIPPLGTLVLVLGTSDGVYVGYNDSDSSEATAPGGGGGASGGGGGARGTDGVAGVQEQGCGWKLVANNNGFQAGNATASLKTDGEEFKFPVATLYFSYPGHEYEYGAATAGNGNGIGDLSSHPHLLFAAIALNRGRGPSFPRGGDPFSLYCSAVGGGQHANLRSNASTAQLELSWKGLFAYSTPINIFSFAVNNESRLFVATDQGLFSTLLEAPDLGLVWFEMGVSPMMVSVDRGLRWEVCTQQLCPLDSSAPAPAPAREALLSPALDQAYSRYDRASAAQRVQSPVEKANGKTGVLPITTQSNRTHPNVRSVVITTSGAIFVTLYDEGWFPISDTGASNTPNLQDGARRYTGMQWQQALLPPSTTPCTTRRDPNRAFYRGGPYVSVDGGATFRWLFDAPTTFGNATLRCYGQPSQYMTGNFPNIAVDPADDGHVLLAGWGHGGQGLFELLNGDWSSWSHCAAADDNDLAAVADCFEGGRVDTLIHDSNQYAYDFRVVKWNSNVTVSVTGKTKSARATVHGLSRPEVVFTDSRGIINGVWDATHSRFAFLHLNDHYVGVDEGLERQPQQGDGLDRWQTTGLGDTCVYAAGVLPSGAILLAVADGGVARTLDDGNTWTRPSERWPGKLISTSQSESLLIDTKGGGGGGGGGGDGDDSVGGGSSGITCSYVSHYCRGCNEVGTVLVSCDSLGSNWTVIGGWDGGSNNAVNGLNITGSMAHTMTFDYHTAAGLSTRALWLASSSGALFYGNPSTAAATVATNGNHKNLAANGSTHTSTNGNFIWSRVSTPALSSRGGMRPSTRINVLCTSPHAPAVLLMGRGDGLWLGNLRIQAESTDADSAGAPDGEAAAAATVSVEWTQVGASALYDPTAVAIMPSSIPNNISVLVGAGTTKYGSLAGIFVGTIAPSNPTTTSFDLVYSVQRDAPAATNPDVLNALGKMKLSSFAVAGQTVVAGLYVGDYFDAYLPPYLLQSADGGATFQPSDAGANVTNKNVHTLHVVLGGGAGRTATTAAIANNETRMCVCTDGDGMQCFGIE